MGLNAFSFTAVKGVDSDPKWLWESFSGRVCFSLLVLNVVGIVHIIRATVALRGFKRRELFITLIGFF
jgi:hypothetical protein